MHDRPTATPPLTAYEGALQLHAQGRDEEAMQAYLAVLREDSAHAGALNNLGTLLYNAGYKNAARTAYGRAVTFHPADVMSLVNLGNALYDNGQLNHARAQYEAALRVDPACAPAHQGLAYILDKMGEARAAKRHRDLGYRGNECVRVPYRGTQAPVEVLLLVSAAGGNVGTDRFLDDRFFGVTKLFAEYYDDSRPLPAHALVFNAIGDAELCAAALAGARRVLARTNAPAINHPDRVIETARAKNAARFRGLPGIVAPKIRLFSRNALLDAGATALLARHGLRFPLLLRTPGFHTGYHFVKVESPEGLPSAVAQLPGKRLAAIEFVDVRGGDGYVRKYRVMSIGGVLYPLHLAVAAEWKVHYYTAPMKDHAEHRAEEAAFLENMEASLGPAAVAALETIASTMGLDYAGIDFALDGRGVVVPFEANATMMVPAVMPDPDFAYRATAIERIARAVREMLLSLL